MYTVRQLIQDAYVRSTLRGFGETIEDEEVRHGLACLNDILVDLNRKQGFSTGIVEYIVNKPQDRDFITFSDSKRRICSIIGDDDGLHCHFSAPHKCVPGDEIVLRMDGEDIETSIAEVDSITSFTLPNEGNIVGSRRGSFKLASEGPEYLIDIIGSAPVNIFKVVGSGVGELPECEEQTFFACGGLPGNSYFYEKTMHPYPKIWIKGAERIKISFNKPFITKVELDTDLDDLDELAVSAVKYRLAAELAVKYPEIEEKMMARYKHAMATFTRSKTHTGSPYPDTSAPGYGGGRYNILTDGVGNASF